MEERESKLSIIIPCYNEELNLPKLIKACKNITLELPVTFIFVDNGSTDNSWEILWNNQSNRIHVMRIESNTGYGNGILLGIYNAFTPWIGWVHADQVHLLANLPLILSMLQEENLFIKGVRVNRILGRRIVSASMSNFCSVILGVRLREINAQPSIFPGEFVRKHGTPPTDFSIDLYYYYWAKLAQLREIRIQISDLDRVNDNSRWNTGVFSILQLSIRTLKAAFLIRRRAQ